MSTATQTASGGGKKKAPPPKAHDDHGHGDGHGHGHGEHEFLAHHFDTPEQQFEAGKLGIWLFLVTEVLFFAGLFCAYTIYRAMNPEVYEYAHYFLDTNMGALNTVVLLVSSFTAAYAVRCAQLGDKNKLMVNIVITILCACAFMGVKYIEYSHKFHDGLLPGRHFHPHEALYELPRFKQKHPEAAELAERIKAGKVDANEKLTEEQVEPLLRSGMISAKEVEEGKLTTLTHPPKTHVFFGIYFFMTGLHGLHVLIGIGIWVWMLIKASKGVFNKNYFGPIDYTALYWHLVDLIWIYLFPLLYLIS
jgi:cytochrome c oxidase subunit III